MGHKVATGETSAAEVTFSEGVRAFLGERSQLPIAGGAGSHADTALLRGTLRIVTPEPAPGAAASRVMLATPLARVTLASGEGEIFIDDDQVTRVAVYRGKWELLVRGKEVVMRAGYGIRVDDRADAQARQGRCRSRQGGRAHRRVCCSRPVLPSR